MRYGKYQPKKSGISPFTMIILALAVLTLSVGSIRAYLSISGGSVANAFQNDMHPVITVDENYQITVTTNADGDSDDKGYQVYLRAAVVANWDDNSADTILAAKDGEYTLTAGSNWFLHSDGFYYYRLPVSNGGTTSPVVSVTVNGAGKSGYKLQVDVAVQAIQALGTTDDEQPIDAVQDAWSISKAVIQGTQN